MIGHRQPGLVARPVWASSRSAPYGRHRTPAALLRRPAPASTAPAQVCSFQLPQVCSFRLPLTSVQSEREIRGVQFLGNSAQTSSPESWGVRTPRPRPRSPWARSKTTIATLEKGAPRGSLRALIRVPVPHRPPPHEWNIGTAPSVPFFPTPPFHPGNALSLFSRLWFRPRSEERPGRITRPGRAGSDPRFAALRAARLCPLRSTFGPGVAPGRIDPYGKAQRPDESAEPKRVRRIRSHRRAAGVNGSERS